jgi:hypothetical protein
MISILSFLHCPKMMKIEPRPPKAANLKAFLKINKRASLQAPQKLFPLIAIYHNKTNLNKIFKRLKLKIYLNISVFINPADNPL